jgi:lysophospholipase L1-like esterase
VTQINLYRTVLAPALLAQVFWVRRRVPRLPEPIGFRTGRWGTGPDLRLLIVGDSSAAGVGVSNQEKALSGRLVDHLSQERRVSWTLVAQTGATTEKLMTMLENVPPGRFDIAVTALGVNDITAEVPLAQWMERTRELHARLMDRFDVGRIIVSGLPPMAGFPSLPQPLRWYLGRQARLFDEALKTYLKERRRVEHLPMEFPNDVSLMASDGYHPGEEVYEIWARRIAERCLGTTQFH